MNPTLRRTRLALLLSFATLPLGALLGQAPAAVVLPGDNFFAFANRAWLDTTRIPAGMERWSARNEVNRANQERLATIIDDAVRAPVGPLARQVGAFYAAYADSAAIEARGLAPLRAEFARIAGLRTKAALATELGRDVAADVDPRNWGIFQSHHVMGLSVDIGQHGEPKYRVFLVQGGLGLPDRENYLSNDAQMVATRDAYERRIIQLLAAAGFDRAEGRAARVMALETSLARSQESVEASSSDFNADSVWTRADYSRRAPGMAWARFFAAAGLGAQDTIVAWQPSAVTGLAALVASEPMATWQDYLRVRLLTRYADLLPSAFSAPDAGTRADRARAATTTAMSDRIGRLYAERFFSAEDKARVEAITRNVITAFEARVRNATWMSPASRAVALVKLDRLRFLVGYPDQLPDLRRLEVDSTDPVGNARRLEAEALALQLARVGRPVDRSAWNISTQRVGAVLNFQLNSYNFPAGLLQPPKYDPNGTDAANYGAIGAIIGHEASHFVDLLGADYDTTGAFLHWWTAEDLAGYRPLSDRLMAQMASYDLGEGRRIDPKRTETENVADLAGVSSALDALHATFGARIADTAFVHAQDRDFFVGYARAWRGLIADGALAKVLGSDTHSPEIYRAATVRNLDAWYAAFDVRPGQRLYLAPGDRVRIW